MSTSIIIKKLIVKYLLAAMVAWVPLGNHVQREHNGKYIRDAQGMLIQEDIDEVKARYQADAEDMVDVAFEDGNTPLYAGTEGRLKTALQLAAVASFEGGFQKFVEDGDCNQPGFHADGAGGCDGGHAYSNWQIHLYGYIIKDGTLTQMQYVDKQYVVDHQNDIVTGEKLIADHRLAAQTAYYLMRYSLIAHGSLCSYTGESCMKDHHPKADQRFNRAKTYLREHLFVLPSAEELEHLEAEEAN